MIKIWHHDREAQPDHAEGHRMSESGWYWQHLTDEAEPSPTMEPVGPFLTELRTIRAVFDFHFPLAR